VLATIENEQRALANQMRDQVSDGVARLNRQTERRRDRLVDQPRSRNGAQFQKIDRTAEISEQFVRDRNGYRRLSNTPGTDDRDESISQFLADFSNGRLAPDNMRRGRGKHVDRPFSWFRSPQPRQIAAVRSRLELPPIAV
jgi:hypothetical protein